MRYASIDCGVRNLAICVFDADQDAIERWEVVDLVGARGAVPQSGPRLAALVVHAVADRPWLLSCDRAVIERQPSRNPKMVCVQNALIAALIAAHRWGGATCDPAHVSLANPRRRWAGCGMRGKRMYAQRKSAAVRAARTWLHRRESPMLAAFEASAKKDDLADCLVQALLAIPDRADAARGLLDEAAAAPSETRKGVPRPRAPTAKQTASGKLSKANVAHAWFVGANGARQTFARLVGESDALARAVARHFGGDGPDPIAAVARAFGNAE